VRGNAVFIAALIAQSSVVALFFTSDIGYLWFNVIGCGIVVVVALVVSAFHRGAGAPTLQS
jgi:solute:Na+ symporter, SSS family